MNDVGYVLEHFLDRWILCGIRIFLLTLKCFWMLWDTFEYYLVFGCSWVWDTFYLRIRLDLCWIFRMFGYYACWILLRFKRNPVVRMTFKALPTCMSYTYTFHVCQGITVRSQVQGMFTQHIGYMEGAMVGGAAGSSTRTLAAKRRKTQTLTREHKAIIINAPKNETHIYIYIYVYIYIYIYIERERENKTHIYMLSVVKTFVRNKCQRVISDRRAVPRRHPERQFGQVAQSLLNGIQRGLAILPRGLWCAAVEF